MFRQCLKITAFLALSLALCLPAFGIQQSPRIFFSKKIKVAEEEMIKRHVVRPGEHLFQILRDYGIQENDLSKAYHTTALLNPGVRNLDHLHPGQELLIPLSPELSQDITGKMRVDYKRSVVTDNVETRTYSVRSGDQVVKLLREAGLSDKLIFDEYLHLFSQLNPQIHDIDMIDVGQQIIIPLPPDMAAKLPPGRKFSIAPGNATQPDENATLPPLPTLGSALSGTGQSGAEEKKEPEAGEAVEKAAAAALKAQVPGGRPAPSGPPVKKKPTLSDNRSFFISLMKNLGFRFTPGQELLYPAANDSWFKVNLEKTPLGRAPWGRQYVFLPRENTDQEKNFQEISHTPILVHDWNPRQGFENLSEKSDGNLKLWSDSRPLILNKGGITLELKATMLVRMSNNRFHLINLLEPNDPPAPALLQAFFSRKGIYINEWQTQLHSAPTPISLPVPRQEDLLVTWIDKFNAWPDIKLRLSPEARTVSPDGADIESVLAALDSRGLVSKNSLRLSWFAGRDRELALTVPAIQILDGPNHIVLLKPEQASPHLVALLSLKGYIPLAIK